MRVPQGELMLMYIPQIRGPNGGASVEVNHQQLRELLSETDKPSSLVMLPSGGLLLMSLSPYTDTDHRYSLRLSTYLQIEPKGINFRPYFCKKHFC